MIDTIIQEIAGGENRYCDRFKDLAIDEQCKLLSLLLRENDIEINTVASTALIEHGLLADCFEGFAITRNEAPQIQNEVAAAFFVKFILKMHEKVQDCIDEYNEALEATLTEPPRPNSDYQ